MDNAKELIIPIELYKIDIDVNVQKLLLVNGFDFNKPIETISMIVKRVKCIQYYQE